MCNTIKALQKYRALTRFCRTSLTTEKACVKPFRRASVKEDVASCCGVFLHRVGVPPCAAVSLQLREKLRAPKLLFSILALQALERGNVGAELLVELLIIHVCICFLHVFLRKRDTHRALEHRQALLRLRNTPLEFPPCVGQGRHEKPRYPVQGEAYETVEPLLEEFRLVQWKQAQPPRAPVGLLLYF